MSGTITPPLPRLRPAQARGVARWVAGPLLAQRATPTAGRAARVARPQVRPGFGTAGALRPARREGHRAGAAKAAPCATHVADRAWVPAWLRGVSSWGAGREWACALEAPTRRDQGPVRSLRLRYCGWASPSAWPVAASNQPGA